MIGKIIKWKRIQEDRLASELTEKVFITMSHLSNIEKGRRVPSSELLLSLSEELKFAGKFEDEDSPEVIRRVENFKFLVFRKNNAAIMQEFKELRNLTMTPENYLAIEIFFAATQIETYPNVVNLFKFCEELASDCDLHAKNEKFLLKAIVYFLMTVEYNQSNFAEALKWQQYYLTHLTTEDFEELAFFELQECLIEWEMGARAKLFGKLPEIKNKLILAKTHDYLNEIWNYLYGQCLLYYGFADEAALFFKKIIDETQADAFNDRLLAALILLYAYVEETDISKDEIMHLLKLNRKALQGSTRVIPFLYTFETAILQEGHEKDALKVFKVASELEVITLELQTNKEYFEILYNYRKKNYMLFVELSENYLNNEKNLAHNPFQGVDVCKLLIRYYDGKRIYKQASVWGSKAIKISNTYFGCKSLV